MFDFLLQDDENPSIYFQILNRNCDTCIAYLSNVQPGFCYVKKENLDLELLYAVPVSGLHDYLCIY